MFKTAREALIVTARLWLWLAVTGNKWSGGWPGHIQYPGMSNHCPLCQYAKEIADEESLCRYCPLYGKWGNYQTCTETDEAPFDVWYQAPNRIARCEAAWVIVDLCLKALEELC